MLSPSTTKPASLADALAETASLIEESITDLLPKSDRAEARLFEAMRYGCIGGGKRMRPLLVLQSAALFGVGRSHALRAATAIEFVHCYSLIHDDLPAMDDSDLRRGRPTVHKQFDEAIAVLAGDALLTLAFEVLADPATHEDPHVRCQLVTALAMAAGPRGMVGGQMLDLIGETQPFDAAGITRLQRLKTGELIAFSCEAGAILGRASPPQRHALRAYAHDLGLAFQMADDILDATGSEQDTGKSVGQDAAAGKSTFVSILGLEQARAQALMLADQAAQHLDIFEDRAEILRQLARYVVERRG
ncbi:MAG TPA: farnesyl diphosphate synthase [Alphaproteobacteria bacterium]|nr:farnesyl diphosphate synthase [Alphaproteobacteria bacterium]